MKTITTPDRGRQTVDIDLDGHIYTFRTPSELAVVYEWTDSQTSNGDTPEMVGELDAARQVLDWVVKLVDGEDDAAKLEGRFRDPHDPIGADQLVEVVETLMEAAAGRPTVSPSA